MPFIKKNICSRQRNLDMISCPVVDDDHETNDYPAYYTPLWFPDLFPEVFSDPYRFCRWLEAEFGFGWNVEMGIQEVIVFSKEGSCLPFSLNLEDIASESFYPEDVHEFARTKIITSVNDISRTDSLPPWIDFEKDHVLKSIDLIKSQELRRACIHARYSGSVREDKARLIDYILESIYALQTTIHSVSVQSLRRTHEILLSTNKEESDKSSKSLSSIIRYLFEQEVGKSISDKLRIPPLAGARKYSNATQEDSVKTVLFEHVTASEQVGVLKKLGKRILLGCVQGLHPERVSMDKSKTDKTYIVECIVREVRSRCNVYCALSTVALREEILCWDPDLYFDGYLGKNQVIKKLLIHEFGDTVIDALWLMNSQGNGSAIVFTGSKVPECDAKWPRIVEKEIIHACLNDYVEGMKWESPPICAVCSRQSDKLRYSVFPSNSESFSELKLHVLIIEDTALIDVMRKSNDADFWDIQELNNMMLDRRGLRREGNNFTLDICDPCANSLRKESIPRLSWRNDLYRGRLPSEFKDITWLEEMVCAKNLTTAIVTRLLLGHGDFKARKLRGNTCAHDMNIVQTARTLPRTPADVNGMISVVFLGSETLDDNRLQEIFYVRREKVFRFVSWLKDNNELYSDIAIDAEVLKLYPESGSLPGLTDRVIYGHLSPEENQRIYEEETAGMSEHASSLMFEDNPMSTKVESFIEKTGVSDAEVHSLPGRVSIASALRNLVPRKSMKTPDLTLKRGSLALPEYNNPDLFPGMYPTLFPYGIAGFETHSRTKRVSLSSQAEYYFDIADREFRYHYSFMFVALNILQRRTGHLYTSFTVQRGNFDEVARTFNGLSSGTIQKMANIIEKEGRPKDLSDEEKAVLLMLRYVNTIATKVPGSAASKTLCRNEIRSYVSVMGVPQVFLTINPSPQHHPLFMLMYGDKSVNLNERYPQLLPGSERAKRLAEDPVTAADFFDKSIQCIFEHLFGWDYSNGHSTPRGGILGVLKAFYGSTEYTERGVLHGHFLLWLEGGLNPSEVHRRMKNDDGFRNRFFAFFEDIIRHQLPDVDVPPGFQSKTYKPATELPPTPLPALKEGQERNEDEILDWEAEFDTEVKLCGEALQRHYCKAVCHKYGNLDKCRFRFPHEIVDVSHFESESNSINLVCRDPTLNYFNPYILVYCRHNHDIRCILSGKSAKAAIFYITDYITKMSLRTSQMLSLMCRAVMAAPRKEDTSDRDHAKTLLHKCLAQFGRKQQIHGQQAARYIRGKGDSISSHKTIPLMSNLAFSHVRTLYIGSNGYAGTHGGNEKVQSASESDPEGQDHDDINSGLGEPMDTVSHGNDDGDPLLEQDTGIMDQNRTKFGLDSSEDDICEKVKIKLTITEKGNVVNATQIHDYLYRDDLLKDLCFLDFVCWYKIEKKGAHSSTTTRKTYRSRFLLKSGHPLATSHVIVQRFIEDPSLSTLR